MSATAFHATDMSERLVISHLAHRGDGIADTATGPVHVAYTLPGETISAGPSPGHADRRELLRIDTASAERIAPVCPHFGVCGGCAVQHAAEPLYRAWKRDLVVSALSQAGIDAPVDDLVDAHGAGRRRITLHARADDGGALVVGFAAPRAHHIVAITQCPVLAPSLNGALAAAGAIAAELGALRKPLDIQITGTASGLDIDVRGSGPLNASSTGRLAKLAETHRLARLTRHGDVVIQRAPPALTIGRAQVVLPAGSFLQATEAGESALASLVASHVGAAKTIVDLFCGIGPFALRLAERARVLAVDSHAPAIDALRQATSGARGLKPIETKLRDLFRSPLSPLELKSCEALVFDPPRQGAEAQARELVKSKVPVVVAVSCNAASFARDARILIGGGYRLTRVTPVDQFRYAAHVEIVAAFRR